jgi:hypothetical protein
MLAAALLLAPMSGCVREGAAWYFEPPELRQAERVVMDRLQAIDATVQAAAEDLAASGVAGPAVQAVLDRLTEADPAIASSHLLDANGRAVGIAPLSYQPTARVELGGLPHVRQVLDGKTPVLSPVVQSPQGPYAIALHWPVLGPNGTLLGCVGVQLRYVAMLEQVLQPIYSVSPFDAFILQLDGRILFDRDPNERGRNVFEDDFYRTFPEFVAVAHDMVASPEGRANARFLSTGHHSIRPQSFVWSTVALHGTEWRVVLSRD